MILISKRVQSILHLGNCNQQYPFIITQNPNDSLINSPNILSWQLFLLPFYIDLIFCKFCIIIHLYIQIKWQCLDCWNDGLWLHFWLKIINIILYKWSSIYQIICFEYNFNFRNNDWSNQYFIFQFKLWAC